jgi:hypothetical protein
VQQNAWGKHARHFAARVIALLSERADAATRESHDQRPNTASHGTNRAAG